MDEDEPEKTTDANGEDLAQYNLDDYDEEDNMPGECYFAHSVALCIHTICNSHGSF